MNYCWVSVGALFAGPASRCSVAVTRAGALGFSRKSAYRRDRMPRSSCGSALPGITALSAVRHTAFGTCGGGVCDGRLVTQRAATVHLDRTYVVVVRSHRCTCLLVNDGALFGGFSRNPELMCAHPCGRELVDAGGRSHAVRARFDVNTLGVHLRRVQLQCVHCFDERDRAVADARNTDRSQSGV